MAKYDEFDLDVQTVKNNGGGNEAKSGLGCISAVSELVTLSLDYCPTRDSTCSCATQCMCPSQGDDCTNTCSLCHSYCGGTCKR